MGCSREVQGNAARKKGVDEVPKPNEDVVMQGDVQVACTECERWFTLQEAGLAGLRKSVIDEMEVFCMKCMHIRHSKMKCQLNECEQRMKRMEETIRDLVESGTSTSAESDSKMKRSPRVGGRGHKKMRLQMEMNDGGCDSEKSFSHPFAEVVSHASSETPGNSDDENSSTGGASDQEVEENGFQVVKRSRRIKKPSIKIIGDSMIKNITRIVKCDKEGSGCFSKRGAGIKEIMLKVKEECSSAAEGSLIVVQGGGNSLKHIGVEDTVNSLVECIKEVRNNRKDLNIAVASILPRPCESGQYDNWRKKVNVEVQKQVCQMSLEAVKAKEGCGVAFLDMDCVMNPQKFARDGVHLNQEGEQCVGSRILTWIKEKERRSANNRT